MNNPHFILDMETIGQSIFTIPVVNCAYTIFDWDRFTSTKPYTFEEIVESVKLDKLDVQYQVKEQGCIIKQSDLDWWKDQGAFALKQIRPSKENDILPDQFISNLKAYIGTTKVNKWWSRANVFDPVILQRLVERSSKHDMVEMNKLLPYWNVRDTRTFIDTRFDFKLKYNSFCPMEDEGEWNNKFVKHYSPHDIAADILRMQRIEQVVNS